MHTLMSITSMREALKYNELDHTPPPFEVDILKFTVDTNALGGYLESPLPPFWILTFLKLMGGNISK